MHFNNLIDLMHQSVHLLTRIIIYPPNVIDKSIYYVICKSITHLCTVVWMNAHASTHTCFLRLTIHRKKQASLHSATYKMYIIYSRCLCIYSRERKVNISHANSATNCPQKEKKSTDIIDC